MDWKSVDEGALLPVKATPGARQNSVRGLHNGMVKVQVTQIAEKGKANRAIIDVLAKHFGISRSRIELIRGASSTEKVFLIKGVDPAWLRQHL